MTDDQYRDLRKELHYIRNELNKLVYQSAEHNILLKEHEARSLALQSMIERERSRGEIISTRLTPIESHLKFATSCLKWAAAILAGVLIQFIVRKFL
jgi:hypothetical protein